MGRMIGIDLGTTNSCVAFMDGDTPTVLPNRQGARTTPSVVSLSPKLLVGTFARRQAAASPEATIVGIKRLIGRKCEAPELQTWKRLTHYRIVPAPNGDAWVRVGDRMLSPEEISALILQELKRAAEEYLGEPVTSATVTVPAYFNDSQRQATRDAGRIAGLTIDNILNEPTAAAIGYGLSEAGTEDQTIAVFDLGGGTFDVTILQKSGEVFEVLSTHGDTFLGGDDFDARLVQAMLEDFRRQHQIDLTGDAAAMYRIKDAAEQAKKDLSTMDATPLEVPFVAQGPSGPLHISYPVFPRRSLEVLCKDLVARLEEPCRIALEGARMKPADIDQILLVGGMTRMPAVRRKAQEIFGKEPRTDIDPDEAVAIGAATQCGILSGQLGEVALLDVTPYSLGVMTMGGKMSVVVPKNCAIPTRVTRTYSTTANYQNAVMIEVFQGESEEVLDNSYLGSFELGKLPLLPAGQVQVDVTFEMNADGVLEVSAKENSAGREASVTISAAGGLAEADLEKLTARHKAVAARS